MTVENQCKLIAERAGALVLSVDYPLAPESPFPVGFDCCYAIAEYAHYNAETLGIDGAKIGVCGDSAGGNLAAACALRNRDEGRWPLAYQALIYPTLSRAEKSGDPYWYWKADKYDNPQNDPVIDFQSRCIGEQGRELNRWYVPSGTDIYSPYLSPVAASAERLPKTLIFTAEYDFLRIECEEYTKMLKKAHVPCRHIRYGGITHGTFDRLGYAPQVEDMINEIAKDLRSL
jgi:acetyl esterase/lipase